MSDQLQHAAAQDRVDAPAPARVEIERDPEEGTPLTASIPVVELDEFGKGF